MNRRVEPRFQVYAPAKLTLLDDPERELDCLLVDISGSGMKLVTGEELAADQMISVEVGQHAVLADVRHCCARGSKFALGVEKIHVMPAALLEQQATKASRIQALLDDYHLRIRNGLEGTTLEPVMTAAAETSQPEVSSLPAAAEIPADPIRMVAQKALETRVPQRGRWLPKVVYAAAGAVAVALWLIVPILTKSPSPPLSAAVPQTPKASEQETPPPAVEPALSAGPAKQRASIKLTGASWVAACADGQKLFEKMLAAGETRDVEFSDKALVRVGNAGNVEIALGGKPVGPLGRAGQLRLVELSAGGMRVVPPGDPATDCAR